jgi:carbonic anhydrase
MSGSVATPFPADAFADVLAANAVHAAGRAASTASSMAGRGLAVLTCVDARIDPLAVLGLGAGDAVVVRNPGARVTDDALASIVLAVHLLGVARLIVVAHTDCRMAKGDEASIRAAIAERSGTDTSDLRFAAAEDQRAALAADVARVRSCPHLPADVVVGAAILDVTTGRLSPVEA